MNHFKRLFASALLLATFSDAALAESFIVPMNTSRKIYFRQFVVEGCTSGGPVRFQVTNPPLHGTVTIKQAKDFPTFPPSSVLSACNGKALPSTQIWYHAGNNYIGTDMVGIDWVGPGGAGGHKDLPIEVR